MAPLQWGCADRIGIHAVPLKGQPIGVEPSSRMLCSSDALVVSFPPASMTPGSRGESLAFLEDWVDSSFESRASPLRPRVAEMW